MDNNKKLELKILALKDGFRTRVATLTDDYEDRIANLRIEITGMDEERTALLERIASLEAQISQYEGNNETEADATDDAN